MSETTLCQQYKEYCAASGVYVGGGVDDSASTLIRVSDQLVQDLVNSLSVVSQRFAKVADSAVKTGSDYTSKVISAAGQELSRLNSKAMGLIKDGKYGAHTVARAMIGGLLTESAHGQFYGGSADPLLSHTQYMVDSYDFVTGAAEEVMERVSTQARVFEAYLEILAKMMKNSSELKDKSDLKRAISEQQHYFESAIKEFKKIMTRMGSNSELTKKLESLASSGKLHEIKELLKSQSIDKSMIDDYVSLLRLQGSTAARADELSKALKVIGMTKSEFQALGNMKQVDELLSKYESKLQSMSGKDRMKYLEAIQQIRDMAYSQSTGEKFEGAGCGCSEDPIPEMDAYDGGRCDDKYEGLESYFGGEFLELEREVDYEFQGSKVLDTYNMAKKNFVTEQSKYIANMLETAQKAAIDFSSKVEGREGEDSVMQFLRRLESMKLINETMLLDTFATYGKDYNAKHIKDEIVSGLSDLVAYAKKLESTVGPSMGKFADSIDDYRKFLERMYKQNREMAESKLMGGVNCSGVSSESVYDRFSFIGGYMDLSISNIVDIFKKSILLGRMQNGLNLGLKDLKDFSVEQDKMNASVLAKEVNDMERSAVEMITKYKEIETFPIKKPIFETVLRNNVRGHIMLLHAAQAMEKKIRSYTEEIISNPTVATTIADLLAKVSVDVNTVPDPAFTDLKEFCDLFHVEAVAQNGFKYTDELLDEVYTVAGVISVAPPNSGLTFANFVNNSYIKKDKFSPFPARIQDCIATYVSTLVAATKDGTFDREKSKEALVTHNSTTPDDRVNYYEGKSILPCKDKSSYARTDDRDNITSPNGLVKDVKFLNDALIMRNYNQAITALREAADRVLNMRNLFSIFEHIDDAYKKSKGIDDGVKIGQIYGAIKEYLILTSIYPIIYKNGEDYTCGFLAMRHFGHDIVSPFEDEKFQYRLPTGELLYDLGVMDMSLKEFYEGLDIQHHQLRDNHYDPFPRDKDMVLDKIGAPRVWAKDLNFIKSFEHTFKARYARFDLLFTSIIKSMFAKIMSVLAMYNLINFNGSSVRTTDHSENLPFSQLRTIYGGDSIMEDGFYSMTPEVKPECSELYLRLYYYILFYKKLFLEEDKLVSKRIIDQVAALKRFALLPVQGSKFSAILKIFFLKNFDKTTSVNTNISDTDLIAYISECNKLYDGESGSEKVRFDKIIKEFVRDINKRYGLVKTSTFKSVMEQRKNDEYPDVARMSSREEYHTAGFKTKKTIYNKPELLDGEDSPIGDLNAPSAKNENVLPVFTKATTLIKPQKEPYKIEELLSAVYAFRSKLDKMTNEITNRFDQMDGATAGLGSYFANSVSGQVLMLKTKLATRTNNLDRYRILKEFMLSDENNKVFNIAPEVILYRELVVNNLNLLYKLYTRIIANVNIYGIDNEWTDPILRGTFLYYLDSVNTDLVTVSRLGKAPVLDFSTLQSVMVKHLERTRELHNMLRGGIEVQYADKMEKAIVLLINVHRSVFKDDGVISKINYEDKQATSAGGPYTKMGVKLYPTNDYSEYTHVSPVAGATARSQENAFIFDTDASRYLDPVILKDPRAVLAKGKLFSPDLEFELLSENFSPKNIYLLFEAQLALMYKVFYERHGVWYGPLLDTFIESLSHISFGNFDIVADTTSELGGREIFEADLPFSNKMVALYKTVYRYRSGKDTLLQSDITLLSDSYKSDLRKYLPLFLFLFKFIIKQAYLHTGMLADQNIVNMNDEIRPPVATKPYSNIGGVGDSLLYEITGGAITTTSNIREFMNNIDDIVKSARKLRDTRGGVKLSTNITGVKSDNVLGANIGEVAVMEFDNKKVDDLITRLVEMQNTSDFEKLKVMYARIQNDYGQDILSLGLVPFENTDMVKKTFEHYPIDGDDFNTGMLDTTKNIKNDEIYNLAFDTASYDFKLGKRESAVNLMAMLYGIHNNAESDAIRVIKHMNALSGSNIENPRLRAGKIYTQAIDDLYLVNKVTSITVEFIRKLTDNGLMDLVEFISNNLDNIIKEKSRLERGLTNEDDFNKLIKDFHNTMIKNADHVKMLSNIIFTFIEKQILTPDKYEIIDELCALYNVEEIKLIEKSTLTDIINNIMDYNNILSIANSLIEFLEKIEKNMKIFTTLRDELSNKIKNNLPEKFRKEELYPYDINLKKLISGCVEYASKLFPECFEDGRYELTADNKYLVKKLINTPKYEEWVKFEEWFYVNYIAGYIKSDKRGQFVNIRQVNDDIKELLYQMSNDGTIKSSGEYDTYVTKNYRANSYEEKCQLLTELMKLVAEKQGEVNLERIERENYEKLATAVDGLGNKLKTVIDDNGLFIGNSMISVSRSIFNLTSRFETTGDNKQNIADLLNSMNKNLSSDDGALKTRLDEFAQVINQTIDTIDKARAESYERVRQDNNKILEYMYNNNTNIINNMLKTFNDTLKETGEISERTINTLGAELSNLKDKYNELIAAMKEGDTRKVEAKVEEIKDIDEKIKEVVPKVRKGTGMRRVKRQVVDMNILSRIENLPNLKNINEYPVSIPGVEVDKPKANVSKDNLVKLGGYFNYQLSLIVSRFEEGIKQILKQTRNYDLVIADNISRILLDITYIYMDLIINHGDKRKNIIQVFDSGKCRNYIFKESLRTSIPAISGTNNVFEMIKIAYYGYNGYNREYEEGTNDMLELLMSIFTGKLSVFHDEIMDSYINSLYLSSKNFTDNDSLQNWFGRYTVAIFLHYKSRIYGFSQPISSNIYLKGKRGVELQPINGGINRKIEAAAINDRNGMYKDVIQIITIINNCIEKRTLNKNIVSILNVIYDLGVDIFYIHNEHIEKLNISRYDLGDRNFMEEMVRYLSSKYNEDNLNGEKFTGGSEESTSQNNIIEFLRELPLLKESYAKKVLKSYLNKNISMDLHAAINDLYENGFTTSKINVAIEAAENDTKQDKENIYIEFTLSRFPIRGIFNIRSGFNYNTEKEGNIFGNYPNELLVRYTGFITEDNVSKTRSNQAKSKLSTLMNGNYKKLLDMLDSSLTLKVDSQSSSHNIGNLLRGETSQSIEFAKLNLVLQSYICNDNTKLSPQTISGLIGSMIDMLTVGVEKKSLERFYDSLPFDGMNSVTKVISSYVGGAGVDPFWVELASFLAKGGLTTGAIKTEEFAKAAKLYKYLKTELKDETKALTIALHYLVNPKDVSSITKLITLHTGLSKLTSLFSISSRFTTTGKAPKKVKSSSVVTPGYGATPARLPNLKLFKRDKEFDIVNSSGKTHDCLNNLTVPGFGATPAPPGSCFWVSCGEKVKINDMIARAKNAVKYATLIYKSLFKVYTSISEKPRYLDSAPYVADVYEIVGKEKNIAPTSVAVDLIPTFVNTIGVTGGFDHNIPSEIGSTTFAGRKPLGLHCNNIRDIYGLFSGNKATMLENVIMFLLDDKLHSITIEDFPYLKSIIDKTTLSDVARPNLSINSLSDYISSFGKLTKYLYELEFKGSFANAFPVFNSLTNPKYFTIVKPNGLTNVTVKDFSICDRSQTSMQNGLMTNLAMSLADNESLIGGEIFEKLVLDVNTNSYTKGGTTVANDSTLGNIATPDNDSLVMMLELNTNTKEMLDYLTRCDKIKNYTAVGGRTNNVNDLINNNIVDVGIMPININAMMREIPLASLINGVYSFDKIVDWLTNQDKVARTGTIIASATGLKDVKPIGNSNVILIDGDIYKNPLNINVIPLTKANDGILFSKKSSIQSPRSKVAMFTHTRAAPTVGGVFENPGNGGDYEFKLLVDYIMHNTMVRHIIQSDSKNYVFDTNWSVGKRAEKPILYKNFRLIEGVSAGQNPIYSSSAKLDTGLGDYSDKPEYKLLSTLSPKVVFDPANTGPGTVADVKNTYYENQSLYPIVRGDVHHGVDPDLRTPILAANLYSELLLVLYNQEFRRRHEQSRTLSRNSNTIIKGVSSLYQK